MMRTVVQWSGLSRLAAVVFLVAAGAVVPTSALAQSKEPSEARWESMKTDVFGDRSIGDAAGVVSLEAPKRAQDAALVPVDLRLDLAGDPGRIRAVTLIVDANPAPVAAVFTFGKDAAVTHLSTRLRVNDYSYIRAIAETSDGALHMTKTYVKASGGCSAPALKNQDEAKASLGKMKLRVFAFDPNGASPRGHSTDMQLLIRHPNNSGLQMDQITRYYIPPHFINALSIKQGDRLIFRMESGISISEDPNFRFEFAASKGQPIDVEAGDTEENTFRHEWPFDDPMALQ
ncbi:quinoprotein dehydrogenase-associated SoxYZ-like carrier [Sinorhizobium sp. BG8]|uniref:quinoprotein dehydrogenase-associated SoxYZ-like carrier n=1 Tax=Sinorhizobium sp. BG8 TaxID=2613773 RepID=UPI00193E2200|nr:quinoprotein dehydrogenase-associated SoxYZ-like carrier [Sinorhizobium sp. BG8]QRM57553.1 quinoprotein dehydrogenase-associated SoxYZ-like carrier [Sinorhizobium sp. BG8]